MNAPIRALPGRKARRVKATGPRPDLMWLLWAFLPLELSCTALTGVLGRAGALVLAGLLLVALVVAIAWSTGGQS